MNFDQEILPVYSPISSKGGRRRSRRTKHNKKTKKSKTRRAKKRY